MSHDDGNSDPRTAREDAALSGRLRELEKRLAANRVQRGRDAAGGSERGHAGAAQAMRMAADFVAGVLVGGAIGWGLDRFFGTSPWGLAVFLLLGFAAGILNVLRTSGVVRTRTGGTSDFAAPAKKDRED
jgi:ATP synthase protein I